jgi:hypothetical protein
VKQDLNRGCYAFHLQHRIYLTVLNTLQIRHDPLGEGKLAEPQVGGNCMHIHFSFFFMQGMGDSTLDNKYFTFRKSWSQLYHHMKPGKM